jgi:hypothetical protein
LFKEEGKLELQGNENKVLLTVPDSAVHGHQRASVIYTEIRYGSHPDNKTAISTFNYDNNNLDIEDAVLSVRFINGEHKI